MLSFYYRPEKSSLVSLTGMRYYSYGYNELAKEFLLLLREGEEEGQTKIPGARASVDSQVPEWFGQRNARSDLRIGEEHVRRRATS